MQSTSSTERNADTDEFVDALHAATPRLIVTPALLALNIGVFLAMTAMGVNVLGGRVEEYLHFGANFAPLTTDGAWWRLVSCTFLHFGIVHLAFNMWALWDSGQLVERLFGNLWFVMLYLFAGICGSFASMLWNPRAISAGASGAIFGVFGALLAYMLVQHRSIPAHIMNHLRVSTGIFVAYSMFFGFAQQGIDNAAHLGGLAGGFLMGAIAARPLETGARRAQNPRRALLGLLLAAVTLPAVAVLTPDAGRVYRQAIALQKAIEAYDAEEQRLNAAFEDVINQSRSGKINDRVAIWELRLKIVPAWDKAISRLSSVELDLNAPAHRDYELLLRYAVARRDMIRAIADYLENNDPAQQKKIAALSSQAAEALRKYRELQKK